MARTRTGCLTGCLTKLVLWAIVAVAFVYVVMVGLNPWALHIGGRSTPLLYWHGSGVVHAANGKAYPLYISFWPDKPGRHNGGRREGKGWSADLTGNGWLCPAPGQIERMNVSGTMYGGYSSDANSLLSFRILEWRKPFSIDYQHRGFFDLAGMWHNGELVLDRQGQQGIKLNSGPFIDHATATLHWTSYEEFETACRAMEGR